MREDGLTVLITGTGGGGVGEQCMGALRLSKIRYRIIATDMKPMTLGLFLADKSYIVPSASDPNYVERLLNICENENVKVIIPGSEPELMKISDERKKFEEKGIVVLVNDQDVIKICQDKWRTYNFLKDNGFKVPRSYLPKNDDFLSHDLRFPVIIKPHVGGGGSKNLFLAQNDEELVFFVKYLRKLGVSPMVQEYVGSDDEEYTVGVLSDREGEILGSIAVKRIVEGALSRRFAIREHKGNRIFVVSTGVSQGLVGEYKNVRKNAEGIAERLGSRGPINIQCRLTEDGVYTFEINPRFSGTTSIRALCGFNEPDTLIRKYVLGEKIREITFKKGLVLRGLKNYYISPTDYESLK